MLGGMTINMNKLKIKKTALLILLVLLTIIIRIPNTTHPTGADTFSSLGAAESILAYGYAIWILHPMSLIGMYPLSHPSSGYFFLSFFSVISGLNMEYSILITQIFISVLGVLGIYIFAKEFSNFLVGFISAFVFSISIYFVAFTKWFVTTRILFIVLLPFFLWFLLKIAKEKAHRIKYTVSGLLMLLFLAMTHRLVQLVVIVLIAYFLTAMIFYFPKFKKTRYYKIYFEKRYNISKSNIILDVVSALFLFGIYNFIKYKPIILAVYTLFFILMILPEYKKYSKSDPIQPKSNLEVLFTTIIFGIVFFLAKQMDLLFRQRLMDNLSRLFSGYYTSQFLSLISKTKNVAILTVVIIIAISIYYFLLKKKSKIIEETNLFYNKIYVYIMKKPRFYFSVFVLIIFTGLFISQFLGFSFYTPSEEEYTESLLFKGSSPFIIFLNMVVNYFTGITLLLPFVVFGLLFLLFKKEKKSFAEVFLIIILLGLTPLLIDKRYTRVFVIPFLSLFAGIGIYAFFNFIVKLKHKRTAGLIVTSILIASIIFSNVFVNREFFISKVKTNEHYGQVENAALFLKDSKITGTIIFNDLTTDGRISALSGKPNINFLEPIVAKKAAKSVVSLAFPTVLSDLLQGNKITSFGKMDDWIFSGTYYSGRHEYSINRFGYNDQKSKLVMEAYNVRYSIGNKVETLQEKNFHSTVSEIKNKVYDNPIIEIIDISKGR